MRGQHKMSWEWPAVAGVMLIAAAFRLLLLNDVPPGLHHDEVIIGQIAKDILRGRLAIYFTPGFGHEPLYHYVLAGMFAVIDASAFVLRLTSAFIAILGLAVTYRCARRVFSSTVALGAIAWMAVSLWPIFFARLGLRGISLPLMTTLTTYFLWKALSLPSDDRDARDTLQSPTLRLRSGQASNLHAKRPISNFLLPGILLGLTLYTYQASRVFPMVFGLFALYILLFHRDIFRQHWRGFIVFFGLAAIVAAPLVTYLTIIDPGAEARLADLSGPLSRLAAGDPSEVIRSTLDTLGMFTITGDNVPIYNVGGRPVFPEPIGAALFYLGLLVCVRRWRRPGHALMLIWLAISLLPAMVTPFSPNFVRTIAAWPIPFVLCGLAMFEVSRFITRHSSLVTSPLVTGIFVLALVFNALLTARDYFLDWPRGDYVRFWQQTTWTQAIRALQVDPSTLPVAASGLSIQDLDPQTFDLLLNRSDLSVKWFDCRNAILYPGGGTFARYLSPGFFPCDSELWSRYLRGASLIAQPRWPDTGDVIFSLHQFNARSLLGTILPRLAARPVFVGSANFDSANPAAGLEPLALPVDLGGLQFLGWEIGRDTWRPGETAEVDTLWRVTAPLTPPLALFVHVTTADGSIIAQSDGLDVGVTSLAAGDVFVQRHRLTLQPAAPVEPVRVLLGAYHPDTGNRLRGQAGDREVDALVLGSLNLLK